MPNIVFMKDIIEENGKTIYENNMDRKHKFPVGTRVYFEHETITTCGPKFEKGIFEIYSQDRDCDGTPLYSLISESNNVIKGWIDMGMDENILRKYIAQFGAYGCIHGIPESVLMEVPKLDEYSNQIMFQLEEEYKNYK
jgi:hypothetical protein